VEGNSADVIPAGFQRMIDEQQGQLSEYEGAAGQCVAELQEAQNQVRSLQAKIRASESRNQVQTPPHLHLYTSESSPTWRISG